MVELNKEVKMESIENQKKLNTALQLTDLFHPKSSLQWLALVVLIVGITGGGAIGGAIGAVVAIKIYSIDKTNVSNNKKIISSLIYIVLGFVVDILITMLILGLI